MSEVVKCEKECKICLLVLDKCEFTENRTTCIACRNKIRREKYKSKTARPEKPEFDKNYDAYDIILQCIKDSEHNYISSIKYDHHLKKYIHSVYHKPNGNLIYRNDHFDPLENTITLLHASLIRSGIEYKTPSKYENNNILFNTNVHDLKFKSNL